jgi:biotin synthesis protein BioG
MDEAPLAHLASRRHDVYMLYDYREPTPPEALDAVLDEAGELSLVSWSMGVWAGQLLLAERTVPLARAVAINGTLCPVDDCLGIPGKLFADTLAAYGDETRSRFYRRMCRDKDTLNFFLAHQPLRNLEEQREELRVLLRKARCQGFYTSLYRTAIVSVGDRIFPAVNQRRFWQGLDTLSVDSGHYPFHLWESWEELLAFADTSRAT